jgi:hypothetical protein
MKGMLPFVLFLVAEKDGHSFHTSNFGPLYSAYVCMGLLQMCGVKNRVRRAAGPRTYCIGGRACCTGEYAAGFGGIKTRQSDG